MAKMFDQYGAPVLLSLLVALFILESLFDLRQRVLKRWPRLVTNSLVAIPSFALLRFLFIPIMIWLAHKNETWRIGFSYFSPLPYQFNIILAFLLLDYGNYLWHILLHKVPLLWRFHLVHHSDLDLDVSTAFRFHFGEMLFSILFRGGVVVLTGASAWLVVVYEIAFEAATQFHHSNTKLALKMERILNYIIVTPRMHGIHHSIYSNETNSNYSVIFSFWDRLHRTLRLNVHQEEITIGVFSYQDKKELTVFKLLSMPFQNIRKGNIQARYKQGRRNELKD